MWILTMPFKIPLCSLIFMKGAHLKSKVIYSSDSCSGQQKNVIGINCNNHLSMKKNIVRKKRKERKHIIST